VKTLLTVALCLLAVPVLAAPPAPAQAPATQASPAFIAALMPAPLAEATTSVCVAHCWDGSTVTCTGTSCNATDSSCTAVQGNCWSNVEGTKYCPQCICNPRFPHCKDIEGQSCTSGTQVCVDPDLHCNKFYCSCWNNVWVCP